MSYEDLKKEIKSLNQKFDDLIDLVGQGRRPKSHVFTEVEIAGMSPDEFMKNKDLIQAQIDREAEEKKKAAEKTRIDLYFSWHDEEIQKAKSIAGYLDTKEKMKAQGFEVNDPEIEKSLETMKYFLDGSEMAGKFMSKKPFSDKDIRDMDVDQFEAFKEAIMKQQNLGLIEVVLPGNKVEQ